MEVSGTVLQRVSNVYGSGSKGLSFSRRLASDGVVDVSGDGARFNGRVRGIRVSVRARSDSSFYDDGHLQYYQGSTPRSGGREKQKDSAVLTSKKMKLLKGLYKSLSMASELGFSLDAEKLNLLEEVQGKLTSDAAEVLLKQLKAEKKEMKRLKKQEKAKLKAARMKTAPDCESSSSSESSDSDCENTVDMRSLRASTVLTSATTDQLQSPFQEAAALSLPPPPSSGRTTNENLRELGAYHAKEISSDANINSTNVGPTCDYIGTTAAPQKRIEVCMGNKCKKSGAPALLQEFEKVVGAEGAVVSCKCMGKCKTGPNVRVQNSVGEGLTEELNNDSVKIPANPLYIGVSLEDVDGIVASLLGDNQSDPGSGAATL